MDLSRSRPAAAGYDAAVASPPLSRHLPWLALPLALAGAVVAARLHLARTAADGPVPPADPAALGAWLAHRAPPVDHPALAPGAWDGLTGQPALATWARTRLAPSTLPPAVARGLAVHAVPVRILRALGPRSGLDTEALGVLLDPELADRVAAACPGLDPALRGPLCVHRERSEAGRDAALADALGHADADIALWSVELSSGLGPAGVALAEAAGRRAPAGDGGDRTRAHALVVLARALPAAAALQRLARHTAPGDPLAPLALLELSRIEGAGATLREAAALPGDPGLAALAEVGRARAEGEPPLSGGGLLGRGL